MFESENMEFKRQMTPNIYKEVIAFANTSGGIIYIGVDDAGNPVGIKNIDEVYTQITNGIRDAIQPDITIFIKYILQDDNIIRIEVSEGGFKPYYLREKGLKPSGVFIRQGASSVQASPEQIRKMIKDSDGDVYEDMRSLEQELTFNSAKGAFNKYRVEFDENKFIALGICSVDDEMFTNLGMLLSDQCRHTIKAAVFADDKNTVFKDSREFTGSVFKQLDEVFSYLMLCNKNAAEFHGLERIEHSDYPEEAIREALLNAIVHRDYSFSGSIIINVNENCMEFISIGGLLPGLSEDDIRSGISQPRNRKLAEVFHRLKLIESYGTGIRKIFALYSECAVQPKIEITSNTFKMIIPNMNKETTDNTLAKNSKQTKITPQMKTVIEYLEEYGEMTSEDLQELLNIKRTRAYVVLKIMREAGIIEIIGRGDKKKFRLKRDFN